MAASDQVPMLFKNRLHLAGRPQMSTRPNLVFSVRALRNDPMQVARDRRRNTLRIFRN